MSWKVAHSTSFWEHLFRGSVTTMLKVMHTYHDRKSKVASVTVPCRHCSSFRANSDYRGPQYSYGVNISLWITNNRHTVLPQSDSSITINNKPFREDSHQTWECAFEQWWLTIHMLAMFTCIYAKLNACKDQNLIVIIRYTCHIIIITLKVS